MTWSFVMRGKLFEYDLLRGSLFGKISDVGGLLLREAERPHLIES